jgi:hypothetical protein
VCCDIRTISKVALLFYLNHPCLPKYISIDQFGLTRVEEVYYNIFGLILNNAFSPSNINLPFFMLIAINMFLDEAGNS